MSLRLVRMKMVTYSRSRMKMTLKEGDNICYFTHILVLFH